MRNLLFIILLVGFNELFAQSNFTKSSFEVSGNCKMCKKTIEKSLQIKGVHFANWDVDSHLLELEYDSTLITLDQIQLRIAASGYDTPSYRANDEKYNSLHRCCRYERKK